MPSCRALKNAVNRVATSPGRRRPPGRAFAQRQGDGRRPVPAGEPRQLDRKSLSFIVLDAQMHGFGTRKGRNICCTIRAGAVAHSANLIGLLQPFTIQSLCGGLVLEVTKS
jgi:hypothetical protein